MTDNDTVSDANAEKQCIYSVLKIDLRSSNSWVLRVYLGDKDRCFTSFCHRQIAGTKNQPVTVGFIGNFLV